MGKKDECWKYNEEFPRRTKYQTKCMFCKEKITSGGIYRLKFHIAGILGHDVIVCTHQTPEAKRTCLMALEKIEKDKANRKMQVEGLRGIGSHVPASAAASTSASASVGCVGEGSSRPSFYPSSSAHASASASRSHTETESHTNLLQPRVRKNRMDSYFVPRTTPGSQPTLEGMGLNKEIHDAARKEICKFWYFCNIPFIAARVCPKVAAYHMERSCESYENKPHAKLRLHRVAGHITEILELHAERPSFHILFIPGNPGIVTFYRDYLEVLYELLDKKASVTAVGHVGHTSKDWEDGKLFSLEEQINHKVQFIKEELLQHETPIILVSYMIGMYPFLTLNRDSNFQALLTKFAKLPILCAGLSSLAGLLGLFPSRFNRGLIKSSVGRTWSSDAVHVASSYLLRYSMVRNFTYMGMTEFVKLQEIPDWTFMRGKENQIALLFGNDDHWGPLSLCEEVSQKAPGISLAIEKEGHTHAFCCTKAGSTWAANHTVDLIKQHLNSEN